MLRLEGDRGIRGDGALGPGAILKDSKCSGMNGVSDEAVSSSITKLTDTVLLRAFLYGSQNSREMITSYWNSKSLTHGG